MVETLLYALSMLFAVLALVGAIAPKFPAPALSIAALSLLFAAPSEAPLTVVEMFIMFGIAVCVTLSKRYLAPLIAKRWSSSKSGYWGSAIGMLLGFMFYPPTGVILCPLFGAVLGELLFDKSDVLKGYKRGLTSFCAFMVGAWVQFVFALWVLWLLVQTVLPALIAEAEIFIERF